MRETTSVDLSECGREPVHIPGAIQPFGCLIAFSLPTWSIAHVSLNAVDVFGASVEALIGASIETVLTAKIIHDLRNTFQAAMISGFAERLGPLAIGVAQQDHDVLIHSSGQLAIAEFIPCEGSDCMRSEPTALVKTIIDRLRRAKTFPAFLTSAARQIRAITSYDRVMIYKFLPDESGEVVAEAVRSGMEPFMGLRYPASDIPPQARALFKRQWLRMIPDVEHVPVEIVPPLTPKNLPIDLSQSTLRAASPIHIQYLRNMGSAATMTLSIMVGDTLWGLIACHHETPRRLSMGMNAAVDLIAQVFSTQIEAKQQHDEIAAFAKARAAHDRLIATMEPGETIFEDPRRFSGELRDFIPCDGIGVWTDKHFQGEGIVPPDDAIEPLIAVLDAGHGDRVFATDALWRVVPDAARYAEHVSGLLAIPFPRSPFDYLLLFRREVVQTVSWGGDPNKGVASDADGHVLGPRSSFTAWKETVRSTSIPWRSSEREIAETLRVSLLDVILRRANVLDREMRVTQESQLLLVAELNHRVKNVLAVIRSLVRQSQHGAHSLASFTADLQSRIQALSIAHDQLTLSHWKAAPLQTLIEAEAQAWVAPDSRRLVLAGPAVVIEARAYQTLALVIHEMMTNAAKYGALSSAGGRLSVSWTITGKDDLELTWREENGPAVSSPSRRGFGSVVVEQSIPFELSGAAKVDYLPTGVTASFLIPAEFVKKSEHHPAKPPTPTTRADLTGKTLLLVEDSMMIALDAQAMLQNCGAAVEVAATTRDACRAIQLNRFDAAILDVNLHRETSFRVADDLQERAIPFVFATGYGETIIVPDRFKNIQVISKPYVEDSLRAALAA